MTVAWGLFAAYLIITTFWAWLGWKKTQGFRSFALAGDLGPWVVGITLAASITSTATFVINPGFVYQNGLSALIHFGVAAPFGFLLALFLFAKRFRQTGMKYQALTLPDWIGKRYQSDIMRLYFAVLFLILSVTFVVLILKGSALIMQSALGLSYTQGLILIVGFVFSYIIFGGTYAHAYTNTFQGGLMLIVAIMLFSSGVPGLMSGELIVALAAKGQDLLQPVNSASAYFSNIYEVFFAAFIISMGLVCQPHILMKPMYLKSERSVNFSLLVTALVSFVYAGVLFVGLYAHLGVSGIGQQDSVVALYVQQSFSPAVAALISISLLAAGMSTLDGILVGVSTLAVNDLAMNPLFANRLSKDQALKFSRWVLVAMGVASFILALNPPKLAGIFAQLGVYGLTASSLAPVLLGLYLREVHRNKMLLASIVGALVHFSCYFSVTWLWGETINPAVSASFGIYASFALFIPEILEALRERRRAVSISI